MSDEAKAACQLDYNSDEVCGALVCKGLCFLPLGHDGAHRDKRGYMVTRRPGDPMTVADKQAIRDKVAAEHQRREEMLIRRAAAIAKLTEEDREALGV